LRKSLKFSEKGAGAEEKIRTRNWRSSDELNSGVTKFRRGGERR